MADWRNELWIVGVVCLDTLVYADLTSSRGWRKGGHPGNGMRKKGHFLKAPGDGCLENKKGQGVSEYHCFEEQTPPYVNLTDEIMFVDGETPSGTGLGTDDAYLYADGTGQSEDGLDELSNTETESEDILSLLAHKRRIR